MDLKFLQYSFTATLGWNFAAEVIIKDPGFLQMLRYITCCSARPQYGSCLSVCPSVRPTVHLSVCPSYDSKLRKRKEIEKPTSVRTFR